MTEQERFWSKVLKTGVCWEWQSPVGTHGYGQLNVERNGRRMPVTAHRLSWGYANGPLGFGECVLHKCDNRRCVRPDHLFIGTLADNNADMRAKGRWAWGQRSGHAKLTNKQARAIRNDGRSIADIATEYGVSIATVSMIRNGKTWKQLDRVA